MVSTEVKTLSSFKKEMKITISAEDITKIRTKQISRVQKEVQVPGFRKGRVPLNVVQKNFTGTIEQYTLDEALQQGYEEGIKQSELNPISQPVVKDVKYDDKRDLVIMFDIEVQPEIELKKYKGLVLEKTIYKITNEDVEENLNYLRKERATITSIESEAKEGDYLTFDMQELDENNLPVVGKKYNNMRIQLGANEFDPDVEKQLLGIEIGKERVIEKKYPKDFKQKQLAGNIERYKVEIKKIEEEELPELNREFIQSLNLEIETMEDLKNKIREQLEYRTGQDSEQRFYHQFVHELLQQNQFDVPESMVSGYLDNIIKEMKQKDKNINEEEVRKKYRTDALFNIKWFILKDKIAKEENIQANDEDFKDYLEKIEDEKVRDLYKNNNELKKQIINDIFEKNVFEFLVSNSTIKTVEQSLKRRKELEVA